MIRTLKIVGFCIISISIASCAGSLRPFHTEPARPGGITTKNDETLETMPKPKDKIVAAVYRFRDETGQYKPSQNSISYSTAVTQGATSILIKAMENSGWFTPIERAGISNLLNERRIIQSTRKQNNDNTKLRPLLFAGVLLEGGVVGYDTNVITGGAGVRYFGTDVSGQFRKDRVTIYLRAVSTQTGRILKTVRTTKSIISQELSGGLFRYVDANRLLETEIGVTMNEPPVTAVTEAINEAVKQLIIQGTDDGLWTAANPKAFNDFKKGEKLAQAKAEQNESIDYYGLTHKRDLRSGFTFTTDYSYGSYIGSYGNETQNSGIMLQLEQSIISPLSLKLDVQRSKIGSRNVFSQPVTNADLMLNGYLFPGMKLSPYIAAGGGVLAFDHHTKFTDKTVFPTFSGEVGLDYRFSTSVGLKLGVNYRYLIDDGVDGVSIGSIHDQQWNIVTGFSLYL